MTVVLNLFQCWDPLNATDVVWDPQVKIEKVCYALRNKVSKKRSPGRRTVVSTLIAARPKR